MIDVSKMLMAMYHYDQAYVELKKLFDEKIKNQLKELEKIRKELWDKYWEEIEKINAR